MAQIHWQDHIVISSDIHHGEPCIRGTRIPVFVIVSSMASGMSIDEIREAYPQLSPDDVRAALAYAADVLKGAPKSDSKSTSDYHVRLQKIRAKHPKAYEKWTEEDDKTLRIEFEKGASVDRLSELLQRQPSAIRSRLRKLGIADGGQQHRGKTERVEHGSVESIVTPILPGKTEHKNVSRRQALENLNAFLAGIYDDEVFISDLLNAGGLDPASILRLKTELFPEYVNAVLQTLELDLARILIHSPYRSSKPTAQAQRQARILIDCFGLSGQAPLTLAKIGEELGISRERVRQIRNQAFRKLKSPKRKAILESIFRETAEIILNEQAEQ